MTSHRHEAERLAGEALPCADRPCEEIDDSLTHSKYCPAHYIPAVADLLEPLLAGREWRSMDSAPQDGTYILLYTTCHGIVEAWFAPGEWSDNMPEGPREYSGSCWVCADDAFQIEVEELPEEQGGFHHGTATYWQPLPAPPTKENK